MNLKLIKPYTDHSLNITEWTSDSLTEQQSHIQQQQQKNIA